MAASPFYAVLLIYLAVLGQAAAQAQPPLPAKRIATLAPFLAELVFAAGAGSKLVAVSAHSDYPLAARSLPVIADAGAVNRESLLALHVDTVLAWKGGTPGKNIDAARQSGAQVIILDGDRLDDIPRLLRRIGDLAGTRHQAETEAVRFEEGLSEVRRKYGPRRQISAMFEIWHRPLMTISGKHFMSDALGVCGGRNVFADYPGIAPEVSMESVLKEKPTAIIGAGSARSEREFRENWTGNGAIAAVKREHLIYLDADYIQRQTPRILEGVRRLCVALDEIRRSPTATQTARP